MRIALISLLLVFSTASTRAQTPTVSTDRVADELTAIRQTLERLVRLLEADEVRKDADLMLRRIDLLERRVAPLRGRVESAEGEVHGLETEIRRLRTFQQELDDALDDAVRDGSDTPDSDERTMQSQIRAELKQLLDQLEIAGLRKRQAEDDLADAREAIEVLDESLLELLNPR